MLTVHLRRRPAVHRVQIAMLKNSDGITVAYKL